MASLRVRSFTIATYFGHIENLLQKAGMASEACRLIQDLNLKDHYNGASLVEKDDASIGGFGASKAYSDSLICVKPAPTESEVRHKKEHLVLRDESDDSNGPSDAQCVPMKRRILTVEEYNKVVEELYECGIQLPFKYPDDGISSLPPVRYPLHRYSEEEPWQVISDDDDEVEEEMVDEVVVSSNNSVELSGLSNSI